MSRGRDRPGREKRKPAKSFAELGEQLKPAIAPRPVPAKPVGPDPADDPALLFAIHGPVAE